MIIETELTDENPSHWPSSIVPNTSFCVFIWALTRVGDWVKHTHGGGAQATFGRKIYRIMYPSSLMMLSWHPHVLFPKVLIHTMFAIGMSLSIGKKQS